MNDQAASTSCPDNLDLHETPGIIVDRRPAEVRARILGTGLEVWEVVKTYHEVGEDWPRFRACYEQLTEDQLRAALTYAKSHWEVIGPRIAEGYTHVPESLRETIPARWR
ncbi:MAG: DUF433 domain-containing protein [Dehalococcoidia bacterium]